MRQRSIHVLHVITGLGRGGAEMMLFRLVRALSGGSGFRHTVIALKSDNVFDFAEIGVPVRTLALDKHLRDVLRLWTLRRMVRAERPDLVQGWMYHGNVAAALAVERNVPVIWGIHQSLHAMDREKFLTKCLIHAGRPLVRRTRRVVYCSRVSQEQHEAIGYLKSKSMFIPNGFDCDVFAPRISARQSVREELGLPPDALLVGHAARYHEVKNHLGLVAAFARVSKELPDAWLLLAGGGVTDQNAELARAVVEAGIRERVFLLGERHDMPRFFAALDVNVLVSHSEGFPNVLGEAMACGVPCVTTDVGDASMIVADTGVVVPKGDDAGVAEGILSLLRLPRGRRAELGARARARIVAEFSISTVAEKYAALYQEAVRTR